VPGPAGWQTQAFLLVRGYRWRSQTLNRWPPLRSSGTFMTIGPQGSCIGRVDERAAQ
jgi:hypothetical protein